MTFISYIHLNPTGERKISFVLHEPDGGDNEDFGPNSCLTNQVNCTPYGKEKNKNKK